MIVTVTVFKKYLFYNGTMDFNILQYKKKGEARWYRAACYRYHKTRIRSLGHPRAKLLDIMEVDCGDP